MAIGTDLDFYGSSFSSSAGGFLPSLLQPWQQGVGSYLGASSYIPPASMLPATAGGFIESFIPELGGMQGLSSQLSPELKRMFTDWRFGEEAMQPGGAQTFANQLMQQAEIQSLLERSRLQDESAFLRGVEGATSIEDLVTQQMGAEGSLLQQLYGGTGYGATEAVRDLQRFAAGESSGIGSVTSAQMFGSRGEHTEASRQSVLAQLLEGAEGGLVDLGGGRTFNPYSVDILSDEYSFDIGGGLAPRQLLDLTGGIMTTQNAGINRQVAEVLRHSDYGGTFGGQRGYRMQHAIGSLIPYLDEGETLQQSGQMQQLIDQWWAGQAGSGWGRGLSSVFGGAAKAQGLI